MKMNREKSKLLGFMPVGILLVALTMLSCSKGQTSCHCTGTNKYMNYTVGKDIDQQAAINRCAEIEHKDSWDTCLVMKPK